MRNALVLSCAAAALLVTGATAQGVPYGQAIASIHQSGPSATSTPLVLVDRVTNTCTNVTGLLALRVDAVQLDPIDERVWLGTRNTAELRAISITGTAVTNQGPIGVFTCGTSTNGSITGIAFDANGNPVVTGNDCLIQVDRNSSVANTLFTAPVGQINGICTDTAKNIYFGVSASSSATSTFQGGVYRLNRGPACSYGTNSWIGAVTPASTSISFTSVEYFPGTNDIYWNTQSAGTAGAFNGTIKAVPASVAVPSGLIDTEWNWFDYDPRNNDFFAVGKIFGLSGNGNNIEIVQPNWAFSTVCSVVYNAGNEELTSIDACDAADAETTIVPACEPTSGSYVIELSTSCPPNQIAAIFLLSPIAIPITQGQASSGRLFLKAPVNAVGVPPGSFVFVSVCFDPATGQLTVGAPKPWPEP